MLTYCETITGCLYSISVNINTNNVTTLTNEVPSVWGEVIKTLDKLRKLNDHGELHIKGLILMAVFVLVAMLIFPIVNTQVNTVVADPNTSADTATIAGIVPIFYMLAVVIAVIAYALKSFDVI